VRKGEGRGVIGKGRVTGRGEQIGKKLRKKEQIGKKLKEMERRNWKE